MHTVTRALVIDRPWIDLILSGEKDWEMRSRATRIRGRIGLIRSGSGLVVGTARLTGSLGPLAPDEMRAAGARHRIPDALLADPAIARWNVAWTLEDARPLAEPVPYRHPRGAVTWVILEPAVAAALARAS